MDEFEERRVVPLDALGEDASHYEWVTCTGQHFTASEGTDPQGNEVIVVLGWDDAGENVVWDVSFESWNEIRFLAASQGATEAAEIVFPDEDESPDGLSE